MDKITPTVIGALVIGGVIGYFLHSSPSTAPKSETSQTMTDNATSEPLAQTGSKEWKIQNAKSAAIDVVSKDATVMDWPEKEGGDLAELQKGTSDWTCLPDYPASPTNDPMCVDKQGMLFMQAYLTQKTPNNTQSGIGYMLQGGSDASNTDPYATKPAPGEDWLNAPAHLMVFPAAKLDQSVYSKDPKNGGPWIMWAGTPYEHLMVPVK